MCFVFRGNGALRLPFRLFVTLSCLFPVWYLQTQWDIHPTPPGHHWNSLPEQVFWYNWRCPHHLWNHQRRNCWPTYIFKSWPLTIPQATSASMWVTPIWWRIYSHLFFWDCNSGWRLFVWWSGMGKINLITSEVDNEPLAMKTATLLPCDFVGFDCGSK